MADEALIERLVALRGVGRWTVEMLLIFTLGRRDVLPVDDFGVREGYRLAAGLEIAGIALVLALLNLAMWRFLNGVLAWETHLGGFLAGFAAAWLIGARPPPRDLPPGKSPPGPRAA